MAVDWHKTLDPAGCAVLCMEMQQGILDPNGLFPQLVAAVKKADVIAQGKNLLTAARAREIRVVHCTAAFRADRSGTAINTPLIAGLLKHQQHMLEGTPAINVIPEWSGSNDIESRRYSGVSPFTATDLHAQLQAMNIKTVIVMGVSLNLGVTGLCIEASNLGYQVIISNAVAGYPEDYAEAILENTLSLIATPMAVDNIIDYWRVYE